jgi:hypothetical protein
LSSKTAASAPDSTFAWVLELSESLILAMGLSLMDMEKGEGRVSMMLVVRRDDGKR